MGISKSYTKKNEVTPGSIDKNYYAINKQSLYNPEILTYESFDTSSRTDLAKLNSELRKKQFLLSIYDELNNVIHKFIERFPKGRESLTTLIFLLLSKVESVKGYVNIIRTILESSMNMYFITEAQYSQLQSLRSEFNERLNTILESENGGQKKFICFEMLLPFLRLMNIEETEHQKSI